MIAAGGGGIPAAYEPGKQRQLAGIECVIDKDLASELLARELGADLLVMLTDADAVFADWGKPTQRAIRRATPDALAAMSFAAGSMGPKVDAACRFVRATGKRAAIGALDDLTRIIAGEAGTTIVPKRRDRVRTGRPERQSCSGKRGNSDGSDVCRDRLVQPLRDRTARAAGRGAAGRPHRHGAARTCWSSVSRWASSPIR